MKHFFPIRLVLAACAVLLSANLQAAPSAPGYIDFGKFSAPANGGEFVEVRVSKNLISMVGRLAEKDEPEIAKVIRGLRSIRVNVIGLDDRNRGEIKDRMERIHAQLDDQKWERIVTVQEKDESVNVYLKAQGEEAVEGIVVTVMDGDREAILVNIAGDIKLENIAMIGQRFDIEPLKKLNKVMRKS